mgnify:CR=1 FL=1
MTNDIGFVTLVTDTLIEVVYVDRVKLLVLFRFNTRHYIRERQYERKDCFVVVVFQ